jgi:hypothetical protein
MIFESVAASFEVFFRPRLKGSADSQQVIRARLTALQRPQLLHFFGEFDHDLSEPPPLRSRDPFQPEAFGLDPYVAQQPLKNRDTPCSAMVAVYVMAIANMAAQN